MLNALSNPVQLYPFFFLCLKCSHLYLLDFVASQMERRTFLHVFKAQNLIPHSFYDQSVFIVVLLIYI